MASLRIEASELDRDFCVEVTRTERLHDSPIYLDLIRPSLIVGARFLDLAVMSEYPYKSGGREPRNKLFTLTNGQLDAIYAGGRLQLPFEDILLVGY